MKMLAKLVRTEDESLVTLGKFADEAAVAAENERAQQETQGVLEWRVCTPGELGQLTAYAACVLGAFENE